MPIVAQPVEPAICCIFTADPQGLVEFIRAVFDARGDFHEHRPSDLRIGEDAIIMISWGNVWQIAHVLGEPRS